VEPILHLADKNNNGLSTHLKEQNKHLYYTFGSKSPIYDIEVVCEIMPVAFSMKIMPAFFWAAIWSWHDFLVSTLGIHSIIMHAWKSYWAVHKGEVVTGNEKGFINARIWRMATLITVTMAASSSNNSLRIGSQNKDERGLQARKRRERERVREF
jgi:hypothetical protein